MTGQPWLGRAQCPGARRGKRTLSPLRCSGRLIFRAAAMPIKLCGHCDKPILLQSLQTRVDAVDILWLHVMPGLINDKDIVERPHATIELHYLLQQSQDHTRVWRVDCLRKSMPDIAKLIDPSVNMVLSKESANVVQQFQNTPSRHVFTYART